MILVKQFCQILNRLLIFAALCIPGACRFSSSADKQECRGQSEDWPIYGGNKAGNRHSRLNQINLNNVDKLQVAWTYNSEPSIGQLPGMKSSELECQPVVVNGILYGVSPLLKLFALDAGSGKKYGNLILLKKSPRGLPIAGELYTGKTGKTKGYYILPAIRCMQ